MGQSQKEPQLLKFNVDAVEDLRSFLLKLCLNQEFKYVHHLRLKTVTKKKLLVTWKLADLRQQPDRQFVPLTNDRQFFTRLHDRPFSIFNSRATLRVSQLK